MSTVLVVDDEVRVRAFLTRALSAEGHTVVAAANGVEALERLRRGDVDLVLLDVMMPRCNGMQVLTAMGRRDDRTPVIVITAVTDVSTRVRVLDRGAVDVMAKPFHTAEMAARVRRHLADLPARGSEDEPLAAGGIRLDADRRHAVTSQGDVALTDREFALLAHLMRRRGQVCRRDELLREVWGPEADTASNVVDVCVRRLRNKLGDPPIETIRGIGYCFTGA